MGASAIARLKGARLAGASAAVAAALMFGALAWSVASGAADPVDTAVRATIHEGASDTTTQLAFLFSFLGSAPVWLSVSVAAGAVFWRLDWQRAAIDLVIVMTGAIALENALKLAFARARPEVYFGAAPPTFSFPSGHAFFAACLYGALACLIADRIGQPMRRVALWCAAMLLAGAIGWSRIYLGVHHPSDVVAGYVAAVCWIGFVTAVRASNEK